MRHRLRTRNSKRARKKKHSCAYKDNFDILPNVECEIFTLSLLLNSHKFQANIIISTGWFYSNSYTHTHRLSVKYLHWTWTTPTTQRLIQLLMLRLQSSHMWVWTNCTELNLWARQKKKECVEVRVKYTSSIFYYGYDGFLMGFYVRYFLWG